MAFRDASRTRKAYSYYRPRPQIQYSATLAESNELLKNIQMLNALTSVSVIWNEVPICLDPNTRSRYEISYLPLNVNELLIFRNGVLLKRGESEDYVISDKSITLTEALTVDCKLTATYPYDMTVNA